MITNICQLGRSMLNNKRVFARLSQLNNSSKISYNITAAKLQKQTSLTFFTSIKQKLSTSKPSNTSPSVNSSNNPFQNNPQILNIQKHLQKIKIQKGQNNLQYIDAFHRLSVLLSTKSYLQQAIQMNEKVVQLFNIYYQQCKKDSNDQKMHILVYKTLQNLYLSTNQIGKFIEITLTIVKRVEQLMLKYKTFSLILIKEYKLLGQAYYDEKQYDLSLQNFNKSIQLLQKQTKLPNKQLITVQIKNAIGLILYRQKKQLNKAKQVYKQNLILISKILKLIQAKQIKQKLDLEVLSNCVVNLVEIFSQQRQSLTLEQKGLIEDQIDKMVHQELKFYHIDKSEQIQQIHHFYSILGSLFNHLKNYQKSIQSYRIQRQIINDKNYQSLSQCYQNQSNAYKNMNKIQKSIQKLIKAYQSRQRLNSQFEETIKNKKQREEKVSQNNKILKYLCEIISQRFRENKSQTNSKIWSEKASRISIQ